MKKIVKIVIRILAVLLLAGISVLLFFYITSKFLTVTRYTVKGDFEHPIRIVQLTDLHNAEFGQDNKKLVEKIKEQDPDLIFMTGDMLNRDDRNLEIVKTLITELAEVAPVYFGYGNHETGWERTYQIDLHDELSACGAIVLDNEFTDIEVNGTALRIGGYMGYYYQPHMMTKDEEQRQIERDFYKNFEDTDRYLILLNHIPTQWLDWNYIESNRIDLIFCGHYHGGIIRIPFIDQGLVASYVGWFPPYTKGMYTGEKTTCILSAGLGSEHKVPRLNNPPEIVVADLI